MRPVCSIAALGLRTLVDGKYVHVCPIVLGPTAKIHATVHARCPARLCIHYPEIFPHIDLDYSVGEKRMSIPEDIPLRQWQSHIFARAKNHHVK